MKEVLVPRYDELKWMEEIGVNTYKYLTVKAIETMILNRHQDSNYSILEDTYKYLSENEVIASSISYLFPNEIYYSELAKKDIELALKLIDKKIDGSLNNLDILGKFDKKVLQDIKVFARIVTTLNEGLKTNPLYRFEYQEPNWLLDDIFACRVNPENYLLAYKLMEIEPLYWMRTDSSFFKSFTGPNGEWNQKVLNDAINIYAKRYGISEEALENYQGKDIISRPTKNVQRMLKYINVQK